MRKEKNDSHAAEEQPPESDGLLVSQRDKRHDQALKEGFRFLVGSIFQFFSYGVVGVFVILISQDLQKTDYPGGMILLLVGAALILKAMMSLGGFNSK